MDNDLIVSRMNTFLHTSANVLAEWLGKHLPRTSDDWWEDCVMANLSYNQVEKARERGYTKLGQFDLAALLSRSTSQRLLMRILLRNIANWQVNASSETNIRN